MRPSEYIGHHLVAKDGQLKEVFQQLVYGGYGFSTGPHGLDQSVANSEIDRENFVCWDLTHPDAFKDTGQFSILDDERQGPDHQSGHRPDQGRDLRRRRLEGAALQHLLRRECRARRWPLGLHRRSRQERQQRHRKITVFDPVSETWLDRDVPQVKVDFLADPEGKHPRQHADALDEDNTDPEHPSDMKYQRWYPTGAVLPNKKLLILNGTDQDSSLGPSTGFGRPCASVTENAPCSKVRIATPEIYDPEADQTIALENAQKLQPMFARSYVIQTGRGRQDWKVASVGEVDAEFFPGPQTIGGYDPFYYTGDTYLLDVREAARDPEREATGENHWEFVTSAHIAHNNGAGAQIWELDKDGWAKSQKVALFGGDCGQVPERRGRAASVRVRPDDRRDDRLRSGAPSWQLSSRSSSRSSRTTPWSCRRARW